MRKVLILTLLVCGGYAMGDEITFTFLNFDASTFSATAGELQFGNAINVLVTDNTNGRSMTLAAVDSGNTGDATHFDAGPPLVVDYNGSGAKSVLIESGGHVYLAGAMDDEGRLEAEYPNKAGAFLSRFTPEFVDPGVLTALGTGTGFSNDASVSLTLAQTSFNGVRLDAVLGGGSITIETQAVPVAETGTWLLFGTGIVVVCVPRRREGINKEGV